MHEVRALTKACVVRVDEPRVETSSTRWERIIAKMGNPSDLLQEDEEKGKEFNFHKLLIWNFSTSSGDDVREV